LRGVGKKIPESWKKNSTYLFALLSQREGTTLILFAERLIFVKFLNLDKCSGIAEILFRKRERRVNPWSSQIWGRMVLVSVDSRVKDLRAGNKLGFSPSSPLPSLLLPLPSSP
jgi:hypothetical protein